jgi:hypothetical protein
VEQQGCLRWIPEIEAQGRLQKNSGAWFPSEFPSALVLPHSASVALKQTSSSDMIMDDFTVYSPVGVSVYDIAGALVKRDA